MSEKIKWDFIEDSESSMAHCCGYWAEAYEEIDGTFSVTIRNADPVDGERIYYREDIDCLHTAQEIAELVILNVQLKAELDEITIEFIECKIELGEKENYALRLLRNNIEKHNEGVKLRGQRGALKKRVSRKRAEILKQREELTNLKAERDRECIWSQDHIMKEHYCFETQCKKVFSRDLWWAGPMEEFTYCPYCGLKIKNKQPWDQGDE